MRYRRPANKGQRCQRWKRVRGKLRCASFTYPRRKSQMGFRPGHVPANRGARCIRRKRVFGPWYNKKVWRCAKYGPGTGRPERRPWRLLPAPRPRQTVMRREREPILPPPSAEVLPGYIPLSLPSMERTSAGRTPL